jgi:hypothetical protein
VKAICSVNGCTNVARCRTWCEAHYTRWLRHGDVIAEEPIGSPRSGTRQWMGQYGITRAKPGPFDPVDTEEL